MIFKIVDWVIDIAIGVCFIIFLYAAMHSQACVKVYEYTYGTCPGFIGEQK